MNLEIHYSPPGQSRQVVPVRDRLMIGSLLSNEVVIRAPGVEPIHAMIEVLENGVHILTDLGSQSGVLLNGKKVDVESPIEIGDKITIGNVQVEVHVVQTVPAAVPRLEDRAQAGDTKNLSVKKTVVAGANVRAAAARDDDDDDSEHADDMSDDPRSTVLADPGGQGRGSDGEDAVEPLFNPRNAKPAGNVLEVVAYWDDTILDVDMFHPKIKNFEKVTIGTPGKAHFIAGGSDDIKRFKLASVQKDGYTVNLSSDMTARIRKGGKVIEEKGDTSIEMSKNDIAHVTHGAVKYFLMFIKPPVLDLPRKSARDPFFVMIMALSTLFYLAVIPAIFLSKNPKKDNSDDPWSIVNAPETKEVPKPPEKPKVKIAEVEKEKPKPVEPPKPPPKPPTPVKPEEKEKPKPVEQVKQPTPTPTPVKELAQKPTPVVQPPKAPTPEKQSAKNSGMVKAETKPDIKNPGKVEPNKAQGLSGGALGGGKRNDAAGGERKGNTQQNLAGAEGGAPNKASGVNLGQLGLGVGKILDSKAAGAMKTDFKTAAGGAGGGAGSAAKTLGLGGPGSGKTLGMAGSGQAGNNFGGFGGTGSGAGGAGGNGGAGLGSGFGKGDGTGNGKGSGRANVDVPPGDPVVSGGLTNQEVQAVIRANLNQIRHCYETLLQRSPSASGKIKVNFTIDATGRVSTATINSDSINDSTMSGCVTGKIVRWKFPTPRGGQNVNVTYPFVFNPM